MFILTLFLGIKRSILLETLVFGLIIKHLLRGPTTLTTRCDQEPGIKQARNQCHWNLRTDIGTGTMMTG